MQMGASDCSTWGLLGVWGDANGPIKLHHRGWVGVLGDANVRIKLQYRGVCRCLG